MELARIGDALRLSQLSETAAGKAGGSFEVALNAARSPQAEAARPLAARPLPGDGGVVMPASSTDPAIVAAWWKGLSLETRDKLIENHYTQLGTLRGLPAADIDRANRLRLDDDVAGLKEQLSTVTGTINGAGATGGTVDPALFREADRLAIALTNAEKMQDQMDRLDQAHATEGGPKPYLLTYFYQDEGRFAVALGNPDTARNTAVLVPGSGHDVKKEGGPFPTVDEGRRLYDEMGTRAPVGLGYPDSRSVIVWLGADMPDAGIPDGMNGTYGDSEHGARWLHDHVEGYQAAVTNTDSHMTIVAHSYGSYMAGEAIKMGLDVDDLVVVGSPGVGADSAEELRMSGRVWAGAADGDGLISQSGTYGLPPTWAGFGATVFATDGSDLYNGSEGHSAYFNEGSESLDNIAKIATRQEDSISRRPPG